MVTVTIAQNDSIQNAVEEAIHLLGGIERFISPKDKVVIKPNLVFALPPFTGFTTDYPVVRAILRLCQKMKPGELTIAEGSGGISTDVAFRSGGYPELARQFGANLVDLNESPTRKVAVPDGHAVKTMQVPKIILDCDVLINVPKLKLYRRIPGQRAWVSLAVKNLLGTLPRKGKYSSRQPPKMAVPVSRDFWAPDGKFHYPEYKQWWSPRGERRRIHRNLAQGLVDVHMVIRPTLNVIDAFIVSDEVNMTQERVGKPFALNTILASDDPLALDCIATRIGGIDPFNILHLKHAGERGIGEFEHSKIQLLGTPLEKIIGDWKAALKKCGS
jgi:uncharacterized protein (DUF362 family)